MPRHLSRNPSHPTDRATNNAAILRSSTTSPEVMLWSKLKNRQLDGFKFRRQHPIGPYVVDFYCAQIELVIEVDSSYHDGKQDQDAARDAWMNPQSITVLRVTASELAKNEEGVLSKILSTARSLLHDRAMEK
jgi:very-short-patch-repair endonuclease